MKTQERAGLNAALVQSLGSLHVTLYRQQKKTLGKLKNKQILTLEELTSVGFIAIWIWHKWKVNLRSRILYLGWFQ